MRRIFFLILFIFIISCSQSGIRIPSANVGMAVGFATDGIIAEPREARAGDTIYVRVEPGDNEIRAVYRPIYLEGSGYMQDSKVGNNFPIDAAYAGTFTFMLPEHGYSSVEGNLTIPADAATGTYRLAVPAIRYDAEAGSYDEEWGFYVANVGVLSQNYCATNNEKKCDGNTLFECVNNEWEPTTCTGACYQPTETKAVCAEYVDSCRALDGEGKYYLIMQNLTASAETCLDVKSNNTVIDCQGHRLTRGTTATINANNINSLTIRNCDIYEGPGHGISITNSGNVLVEKNTVTAYQNNGIWLSSCRNSIVRNNLLVNNGLSRWYGLSLTGCDNVTVTGNEAKEHIVVGMRFDGSSNMLVKNNTAHHNLWGIVWDDGFPVNITGNEAYNNGYGICVKFENYKNVEGGTVYYYNNNAYNNQYNYCSKQQCIPKTCKEKGLECGRADDGCGFQLRCGDNRLDGNTLYKCVDNKWDAGEYCELGWAEKDDGMVCRCQTGVIQCGGGGTAEGSIPRQGNLVLSMNFDEDMLDSSGNGNNGKCDTGNCPIHYYHKGGKGTYTFDGVDDLIEITGTNILKSARELSIAAWIKSNDLSSQKIVAEVYGPRPHWPPNYGEDFNLETRNDRKLYFYNTESIRTIETGKWYHVVGTYDGTNVMIYINGEIDASSIFAGPTPLPTTKVVIGNYQNKGLPFKGIIDEVKIWNRKLTQEEVKGLYGTESRKFKLSSCVDNEWQETVCDYACVEDGGSKCVCQDGDQKCEGENTLYTCVNGQWQQGVCNGFCYQERCESGTPVSSCQSLNQKNGVYKLISDARASNYRGRECYEGCFVFDAENITLDCLGHKIMVDCRPYASSPQYGITLKNNNAVVKNCLIEGNYPSTSGAGIRTGDSWQQSSNHIIENNTISIGGGSNRERSGIVLGGSGTVIRHNTISASFDYSGAISVSGNSHIISNNTITGGTDRSGAYGTGIEISGNSNIIKNNTISGSGVNGAVGVGIYTGNDNIVSDNKISATTRYTGTELYNEGHALYVGDLHNRYGINPPNNTLLIRNSINSDGYDLYTRHGGQSYGKIILVDQPIKIFDTWSNTVLLEVTNSEYGNVKLLSDISTTGHGINTIRTTDFSKIVSIGDAYAYIGVNVPARIMLYNKRGLNNPQILKDGDVCSECNTVISPAAAAVSDNAVVFEVQGAGNYTISE